MATDKLRMTIARRAETDIMLSPAWCALPLIGGIISIAITIWLIMTYGFHMPASAYVILRAASLIPFVLMLYLIYMLIKRRNTHFRRTQELFEDIVAMLRGASAEKGVDLTGQLSLVERYLSEARMEEVEKSPVLWVILCIIPIVNIFAILYVFYFLMRDWYKHERREDDMWMQVNSALTALGYRPIDTRRPEPMPRRSFFVYLIIYIVLMFIAGLDILYVHSGFIAGLGILWLIYWLYTLIKDPNNHMASQARIEDDLMMALGAPTAPPPTPPSVG